MAFELTETNPFATTTFGELNTARKGFTFDPNYREGGSWVAEFEKSMPDFSLNLSPLANSTNSFRAGSFSGSSSFMDSYADYLMGIKSEGDKALKAGYAMKTVAAAGDLFNSILTYSTARANANLKEANTKQSVENQMLALDNQVLYYKNQIADKFAQTMARNAVTMAEKNLRVTAGNLLEKTKDAAYDATKDIQMLESNAELKKIALRSEARQAEVTAKLTNKLVTANLIGTAAKLGLVVSGGIESGGYGNLFSSGESLNETVYGG